MTTFIFPSSKTADNNRMLHLKKNVIFFSFGGFRFLYVTVLAEF